MVDEPLDDAMQTTSSAQQGSQQHVIRWDEPRELAGVGSVPAARRISRTAV